MALASFSIFQSAILLNSAELGIVHGNVDP